MISTKDMIMSKNVMSSALRNIIRCIAAFVIVGVLCLSALMLSNSVSPHLVTNSISRDFDWIEARGDYPAVLSGLTAVEIEAQAQATGTMPTLGFPKYRYDGFTDAIMLMQAIPDRDRSALDNAIMGPYYAFGEGTGGDSPTEALLQLVANPNTIEQGRDYVLYWHGYVVPMRVLLTFLSPTTIIVINCIIFALLTALVFEVFRRTGGLAYSIAFIVALLATFSFIAPLGFQYFTAYLIAFLATLVLYWLLQSQKRSTWIVPFFLVVGLLTVFFDFLTIPLLTFLLPLALYLLWRIKRAQAKSITVSFFTSFKSIVAVASAWLVGYAGFWACKWMLVAVTNGVQYANSEFVYALGQRSGADAGGIGFRFNAIYNNLYNLFFLRPDGSIFPGAFFGWGAVLFAVFVFVWWVAVRYSNASALQVKSALPMLLVALGPYLWYFVVAQHSTFHSWFSWRLQLASLLAVLFFVLLSINWSTLGNRIMGKQR